jgi:uncharacterized integral membrane protein
MTIHELDPRRPVTEASPGSISTVDPTQPRSGATSPDARSERTRHGVRRFRGADISAGMIVLLVVAFAAVMVVAQNTERVKFDFLWWSGDVPLAVLILVVALVTLLAGQLIGGVWRRRRRACSR